MMIWQTCEGEGTPRRRRNAKVRGGASERGDAIEASAALALTLSTGSTPRFLSAFGRSFAKTVTQISRPNPGQTMVRGAKVLRPKTATLQYLVVGRSQHYNQGKLSEIFDRTKTLTRPLMKGLT